MLLIDSAKTANIKPLVEENVGKIAAVNTDEVTQYTWMQDSYRHTVVKHVAGEYVRDMSYINTIGRVRTFQKSIIGIYHKASNKHIDRYLDMFAWRRNSRGIGEGQRVNSLLKATQGRKITYRTLINR